MPQKVKVEFTKSPSYQLVSATGVWGGISPTGTISAEFFIDTNVNPESIEYELPDGGKGPQIELVRHGDKDGEMRKIARQLQVGVLMSPRDAFVAGSWLIQKSIEAGYKPETPAPEERQ